MNRLRAGLVFVLLLLILAITAILASAQEPFKRACCSSDICRTQHHHDSGSSRDFLLTVGVLGAVKAADLVTTARGSGACRETNPLFGLSPSNGRIAAVGVGYFAGEVVLAYVLRRAFRGHRFLGQLWRIEPAFQVQEHIRFVYGNISIGCS